MIIVINYYLGVIICMCNNISEKEIDEALERGYSVAPEVYEALGCKPQCGSCMDYIKDRITAKSNNTEIA